MLRPILIDGSNLLIHSVGPSVEWATASPEAARTGGVSHALHSLVGVLEWYPDACQRAIGRVTEMLERMAGLPIDGQTVVAATA